MSTKKQSAAQVSPPPEMFTDMERVALSGITKKEDLDEKKREIKPGIYEGAVALSIKYKITKAEPVDAAPQVNIVTPDIIARAIIQMNLTDALRDRFIREVKNAAIDILVDDNPESAKMASAKKDITSQLEAVKEAVAGRMEKKPRSGKTDIVLSYRRLSDTASSVPAAPEMGQMGVAL